MIPALPSPSQDAAPTGTARITSSGTGRVAASATSPPPQTRNELFRQAEAQAIAAQHEAAPIAPERRAGMTSRPQIAEITPRPVTEPASSQAANGAPAAARLSQNNLAGTVSQPAVVPASASIAPQPIRSLPTLSLDPPFSDDLPPVAQLSYEQPYPDQKRVARPLFGELLDEAANPMPILQTGWETPDWDDDDLEFMSPRRWFSDDDDHECEECWDNPWHRLFGLGIHRESGDIGIGHERVALAGFEIDASQPFNHVRVRYDAVYGLPFPDRAEYFWAKSGKGPPSAGEIVNYQDFRVYSEVGSRMISAIVEYPLRSLDPEINGNTTGFGDMVVGNKAVIVDGRYWQITQVFRTYINTGSSKKGLGTGHVSLEPGVLARYKWTDETYLHGEFKFLFPVGADANFAGQVLRTGVGWTHLGYETDTFAWLHSSELVVFSFIDGLKTVAPPDVTASVDGDNFATLLYGMRFVLGPAGDLGLFEVGVNGGIGIGTDWYDGLGRLEFRWSY